MIRYGRRTAFVALALTVPMLLGACGDSASKTPAAGTSGGPSASAAASPTPSAEPLTLAITPAVDAANLPVTTEVGTTVTGGKVSEVALVDGSGKRVEGAMREDGKSWVPASPLAFSAKYTATVTATGGDGKTVSQTTKFTTMGKPGGSRVGTGLYLNTGATYGVAMPVVVEFTSDVPDEARKAITDRLFVKSDPPQPGVWRWFGPRQVLYRPQEYWQTGTKLTVRSALGGLPIGKRFGDIDRSATVTIGRKLTIEIDANTHQMDVYKDGAFLKKVPVSLGKESTPTSSGTMVIMSKEEQTRFRTSDYQLLIHHAQRLTWSGQYLHGAPWSDQKQGKDNVSHGCTNMSLANAEWLFSQTLIGDPVTVRGTKRPLAPGDGWTAWDLTWAEYTAA
jgi:lipoprotein-anchoring transpeptidase ErfK/SrfK